MNRWYEALIDWLINANSRRRPHTATAFSARLRSSLPEAYFQARVDLLWPAPPEKLTPGLRSTAEHQLREAAQSVTAQHSVLHVGEAETATNLALNRSLWIVDANIHLIGAEVTLSAEPAGHDLTEQYEALQRDTALDRARQQAELDRLRTLADQVLIDPGMARLWWLDGKPDKLPELVRMGDVFEEASALVTARPSEAASADPIPKLLQAFLSDLGPEHRALLIKQLHTVFRAYERDDLANELDLPDQPAHSPWTNNADRREREATPSAGPRRS